MQLSFKEDKYNVRFGGREMIDPTVFKKQALSLSHTYINSAHYQVSNVQSNMIEEFIWSEFEKLDVDVVYVDYQPYLNAKDIDKDLKKGFIKVTTLHNNSSILSYDGNMRFRALHDCHHSSFSVGFNYPGEYFAFQHISQLANDDFMRRVFFSEIVLQLSTFYYIGRSYPKDEKVVLVENIKKYKDDDLKYWSDHFNDISSIFNFSEKKEFWQDEMK